MTEIQFSSELTVRLIEAAGYDQGIAAAARVSTDPDLSLETLDAEIRENDSQLLRFLMHNRHGSPFEHGMMKFYVEAPIFVFREFHRHRIGFSYNETSARYRKLDPKFYMPDFNRPGLMQKEGGKPGHYEYVDATHQEAWNLTGIIGEGCDEAWHRYEAMLNSGVAKEVARAVLPVAIYSSMYVTCNPRSIMSFLSLRTAYPGVLEFARSLHGTPFEDAQDNEKAAREIALQLLLRERSATGWAMNPSKPQWEISQIAEAIEDLFSSRFPETHRHFAASGRVAP